MAYTPIGRKESGAGGYAPIGKKTQGAPVVPPKEKVAPSNEVRLPFSEKTAPVGGGPIVRGAMNIAQRWIEGVVVGGLKVAAQVAGKPISPLPGPISYERPFSTEVVTQDKFEPMSTAALARLEKLDAERPEKRNLNLIQAATEEVFLPILDATDIAGFGSLAVRIARRETMSKPAREAMKTLQLGLLEDTSEQGVKRQVGSLILKNSRELEKGKITLSEFTKRQNAIGTALDTLMESPTTRFGKIGDEINRFTTALEMERGLRRVSGPLSETAAVARDAVPVQQARQTARLIGETVREIADGTSFGKTYNVDATPYEGDDAIATLMGETIPFAEATPERITKILEEQRDLFGDNVKLGVFKMDDGSVSVDVNIATPNRQLAERIARLNNQNSYWDAKTQSVVETGGTGEQAFSPEEIRNVIQRLRQFNVDNEEVVDAANRFMTSRGREPLENNITFVFDEERGKRIADAFDAMADAPENPRVLRAYQALADETKEQYEFLVEQGYKIEPWKGKGQPYESSAEMVEDVLQNKHLYFFLTDEGFGSGVSKSHPLLKESGIVVDGVNLKYNDLFRAVHDIFGHARVGNKFGAFGEENAWRNHSLMYSDEARRALTTETRGQNSWFNFGKHNRDAQGNVLRPGDPNYVPPRDRPYAEQKTGLLPDEFVFDTELPKRSTSKERFAQYSKAEGYEPYPEELPTIQAGPTPAKKTEKGIDIDEPVSKGIPERMAALTPAQRTRAMRETRQLFGRGRDFNTAAEIALKRIEDEALPGETRIVPERTTRAETPAREPRQASPRSTEPVEAAEERVTTVPRSNLPVGDGARRVSSLEERVKATLTGRPPEGMDLATYQQMNKADQIRRATKYVEEKPEEAMQVLRGEREAPAGLLNNSIALALSKYAELSEDASLAVRLASLRSTRMGQEISILTEADPTDAISQMREIVRARAVRAATQRLPRGDRAAYSRSDTGFAKAEQAVERVIRRDAAEGVKEVDTVRLKVEEAEKLLDSILC